MDKYDIINELIENNDYKANLAEIVEEYFHLRPQCYEEWLAWFNKTDK